MRRCSRGTTTRPRETIEETLAGLWAELLGLDRIGRRDGFFELGGHSLLAVRLQSRLSEALGVELPLTAIFTRPTLAALAEAIATTLDRRGARALPPIGRVSREGPLALSFAQQRLWFLAQLGAGATYHMPMGMRLSGALDTDALRRSLDRLMARHEALRSVFVSVGGAPRIELLPDTCGFALVEHVLEHEPRAAERLEELSEHEAEAPFDLERGPLIRGRLIRLGPEEHVLLLTQHHIVSDGWSMSVLTRELGALYRAFATGRADRDVLDPLPPLAIQYPDYAAWQRQWLSGDRLETQVDYWRRTLADAPALLELPTDRPRPAEQSFAGDFVAIRLDAELTDGLERVSQEHGTTLFMTLLAAWAAVLARLSGQDDLVIGTVTANRGRREVEDLIGFFVNTLALRIDLSGAPGLTELLARVRAAALGAQDHQDLPFEQVVEIAAPPRRLDQTPIFQVMFSWTNEGDEAAFDLPGLRVEPAGAPLDSVKFDLDLSLGSAGGSIVGELHYASALFDAATIERHRGYLVATLRAMVADADQPVARVDLVGPAERALLLETWSRGDSLPSGERCIHQLFEEQVDRRPGAVAVTCGDEQVTYAELDRRASQLARRLRREGVGPGVVVGLCLDRSVRMVEALLAILKAGGAYLPLDPSYPTERLDFIVDDSRVRVVVTERAVAGRVSGAERLVLLDDLAGAIASEPAERLPAASGPTDLAYVLYTSGSSGRPKGVLVEHRSACAYIDWFGQALPDDAFDGVLAGTSINFDVSVEEIFGTLCRGGRVLLAADALALAAMPRRDEVVLVDTVPSVMAELVATGSLPRSVRYVVLGGERLAQDLVRRIYQLGHVHAVFDAYGPTETTVTATVAARARAGRSMETIGRPIAGARVYLLDGHGALVPIGAAGELTIGGECVARGYLDRPQLTAERFVADPFSGEPGARMYRTGDLARYLPDGNLEFLGRTDNQVKVRGHRIELGEIEARLREHPAVREAVVIARETETGDRRLVAYVTSRAADEAEGAASPGELVPALRRHLADRLPEHMVPSAFVRLDALPTTPSGKLDRKALPAPDGEAVFQRVYQSPEGELEETLAALWAELLGLERIGRHDNFFELGGHSLLAVTLMERLRRLGLSTDIRALFATPTLSALAATLGSHRDVAAPKNAIAPDDRTITPDQLPIIELTQADIDRIVAQVPGGVAGIQDIYALSPLQEGILFHHLLAGESDPYLQATRLAFPDRSLLDRYLGAVQEVVYRHDILRTAFVWEGLSAPAQVVWRRAPLSVTEVELEDDGTPGFEQLIRLADPRRHRMELTVAPLLRFVIAREPGSERWLVLELQHHMIGDHSTADVLHDEVEAILDGRGHELAAPEPFRNLVAQARAGLGADDHERFFRRLLGDIDEATTPFGLAEVHGDGSGVREAHRMLPDSLDDRLRAHARRLGVSLASLCHLAFGQVVARTSGREQVVFGTVLFGRMHAGPGADRAMGLFMNTLPVRLDLDGTGVEDSVRRTHGLLAELLRHEHAALALAQRCSGVPAPAPLFSALLNYRHQTPPAARVEEVGARRALDEMEWLGAEERTNYPLTLSVEDFGQALGLTAQVALPVSPERVCDYMERALEDLADALERDASGRARTSVRTIDILPPTERTLLLEAWNQSEVKSPDGRCVHELFAEQARRTPDAIAVVQDGVELSYAELDRQADRLADHLVARGVGPDVRVALCTERHPRMLVGLLAILKAGGAYVPLDPTHPGQRLADIMRDAGPLLALCDAAGSDALGPEGREACARVPFDPDAWQPRSPHDIHRPVQPQHLAYVIYTSGSTGHPKGVAISHAALVNFLCSMRASPGLSDRDALVAVTTQSFDISGLELLLPLVVGGKVILASRSDAQDGHRLARLLETRAATALQATPSTWQMLLDAGWPGSPTLKALCGGEALPADLAGRLTARVGELWNMYGPTETTIWSSIQRVEPGAAVRLGDPIASTRLYVLAAGEPVPLGVAGELFIAGAGLARGYWRLPGLTADRFVPDPHGLPGERMYATGDLVRRRDDGTLEYLGRIDHQVKLRGHRIELGEIEARLVEHPAVREAVVIAREDTAGERRLVAYVTGDERDGDLSPAQLVAALRDHLAGTLPEYMVPSAFVRLDRLPTSASGKLDRKALPAPDDDAVLHGVYQAPEGEIEETLAKIWADLLGLERVGRHDDFFDLGGHSLHAVRMLGRVRSELDVSIDLSELFSSPDLASFARRVLIASFDELDPRAVEDLMSEEDTSE